MRPVLANFVVCGLGWPLFCSSERVQFIHLDDLRLNVLQRQLISQLSLLKGAFHPTMHRSRMNLFDARDRCIAQAFQDLMDRAQDFFFRRLEVIESRAEAVTKGLAARRAAKN